MHACCECLKPPQILFQGPAESCCFYGLNLKSNCKNVLPCITPVVTSVRNVLKFRRDSCPFPICHLSCLPLRAPCSEWPSSAIPTHQEQLLPPSSPQEPSLRELGLESNLRSLTDELFLPSNLKLFAGLQAPFSCSLLTHATLQPWILMNLT